MYEIYLEMEFDENNKKSEHIWCIPIVLIPNLDISSKRCQILKCPNWHLEEGTGAFLFAPIL